MDFDTLIIYVLLFFFFVLPSILKRKGKKKKTAAPQKKKNPSIFDKLGEGIQTFVRELEKQAMEAKKEQGQKDGSVWDQLDDSDAPFETREDFVREQDEEWDENEEEMIPEYRPSDPDPRFYDPEHPFVKPSKTPVPRFEEKQYPVPPPVPEETSRDTIPGIRANIPAHALQQAVVWSEVLGKPVALRE